jgi:glycerol uptake facilitator-like aquaporin
VYGKSGQATSKKSGGWASDIVFGNPARCVWMLQEKKTAIEMEQGGRERQDTLLPELVEREAAFAKTRELDVKIDHFIEEKLHKDTSPEAKAGRRRALVRAAYGEFMATFFFLFTVLGVLSNASLKGFSPEITTLISAMNAGLQATAICYAFSSVSGAHFNPSISFALWLTNKLSNRKVVVYIIVQLLAAMLATAAVLLIFTEENEVIFDAIVIKVPDGHLGRVFATEFLLTFVLTYVAFTIAFEDAETQKKENLSIKGIQQTRGLTIYAATPQSKTGFAPFVIGFTIFSLALIGGASGGCFNQARLFGPAILSGRWANFYVYIFAEFAGASVAGLMVNNLHRFGLRSRNTSPVDDGTDDTGTNEKHKSRTNDDEVLSPIK